MTETKVYDKGGIRYIVFIFNNIVGDIPMKHSRTIMTAFFWSDNAEEVYLSASGTSACSVLDAYDEQIGIAIATGRALKRFYWQDENKCGLPVHMAAMNMNTRVAGRILAGCKDGIKNDRPLPVAVDVFRKEAERIAKKKIIRLIIRHCKHQLKYVKKKDHVTEVFLSNGQRVEPRPLSHVYKKGSGYIYIPE